MSARDTTEHTSTALGQRELGTKEREVGVSNSPVYGREGLAGAAAAAAAVGASHTMSRSEEKDIQEQGLATREATYGNAPPATVSIESGANLPLSIHEHIQGANDDTD